MDKKWDKIKYSYAAASLFPVKVMLNNSMIKKMRTDGKIPMVHLQLNPTNRCNRHCSFCSFSERDKELELGHRKIINMMKKAKACGCESVTITGGGEPLIHPKINEIIEDIHDIGIEIGLVTNGDLLRKLKTRPMNMLTWCRISASDSGTFDEIYVDKLFKSIIRGPDVDWAFSYVLTRSPEYGKLARVIEFANNHEFTHVRIVSDLLDLEGVPDMDTVREEMEYRDADDSIVNYQERKDFGIGDKDCLISLLKPAIGADGYIYPCCGVMYALENPSRDFEKTMRMGKMADIDKLYEKQKWFDGSVCVKCYYNDYNYLLNLLVNTDIEHLKFV